MSYTKEQSKEMDIESLSSGSFDLRTNFIPEGKATNFQAYVNIVSVLAGAGTLGLPYALRDSGWVGLVILALACAMAIYANQKLIECLYYDGKTRLREYPDVAQAAFGLPGRIVATFFYNSIALGGPVLYLILTGSNIHDLVTQVGCNIPLKWWIVIAAAVMVVPIILTKTMREVAFLSIFGALTTFVVVIIVVVASITNSDKVQNVNHDIVIARHLPLALATFSFSYGGNVIFPHVEESMKNKKAFNKIIFWGILSVTMLYFLCAIVGYAVYGDQVLSPIYLNLDRGATRTAATIIITLHVLLAIPLFLTTFNLQVERALKYEKRGWSEKKQFLFRAMNRFASMVFVAGIAVVVPYFPQVMALLGALSDSMLTFVLPVIFYIKLYGFRSVKKMELLIMALIVIIGVAGCIIGTIDAIKQLVKAFRGELD